MLPNLLRIRRPRVAAAVAAACIGALSLASPSAMANSGGTGTTDPSPTVKGQKQLPARGVLTDDSDAYFDGPHLTGTLVKSGRKDWFRFDCRLEVID